MRGLGANDSRELSMEGMFRSEPLVAAVTVWERRACAVIVNEDAHTRVASGQSWRTRIKRARHCVCVEGLSPRRGAKSLSTPRAGSQSRIARSTPRVHRAHQTTPRFWYIPMPEREATMQMAGRRALRPKKKAWEDAPGSSRGTEFATKGPMEHMAPTATRSRYAMASCRASRAQGSAAHQVAIRRRGRQQKAAPWYGARLERDGSVWRSEEAAYNQAHRLRRAAVAALSRGPLRLERVRRSEGWLPLRRRLYL